MSLSWATPFRSVLPHLSRGLQSRAWARPLPPTRGTDFHRSSVCRCPDALAAGDINTPETFLKAIGRSSETKVSCNSWTDLWKLDGLALRKAGLPVRDRSRYILWAMEKYRRGLEPVEYAHEPREKKKIRGWGPAVQNGKRIRSRRHQ
ncbi:hypothetical protein FA95DRAFT_1503848 [Auriscalpium vulgare]|uniref:Uncharacterized protein n=1 Tax=Auriscalpium vulgare TaxID=40419 RepID=A0ACB8R6Z5_9AGAM|nr:hypothetical protein FA95DRAFT_1503848 [Auriscalpium vulgare]